MVEIRLDSFIYKQQPTLSRSSYSHVDNEGVKALVDSICNRWCVFVPGEASVAFKAGLGAAVNESRRCNGCWCECVVAPALPPGYAYTGT